MAIGFDRAEAAGFGEPYLVGKTKRETRCIFCA